MDRRRVGVLILLLGLALGAACRDSGHLLGVEHAGGHGGDAAVSDDGAGGTGGGTGGGQGGHGGAGGTGSGGAGNDGGPDGSVDFGPDGSVDSGPDAGVGTDGGHACGGTTCAADQVCVRKQTIGGVCLPPDGGCPAGTSPGTFANNPCCVRDPSYACAALPPACGATLTCGCAASTLCLPFEVCATPSSSEIDCTQLVP